MTKYLVCLTHGHIGRSLFEAAELTLGQLPIKAILLSTTHDTRCDALAQELEQIITQLKKHHEVLILTDLYGSTPYNLAQNLRMGDVPVIAGINLPMLLKIMNYSQDPMDILIEKAVSGGRQGITSAS